MKSNDKQTMLQNLVAQNPQYKQAYEVSQMIMNNKNMTKEQKLEYACKQSGMDINQVKQTLSAFGIKL